jgi:hypothetical protein
MTDRPEIEVKRNVIHSGIGIESEIVCIVSANPQAIVKWFKDGKEIIHKKGSITLNHGQTKNNKTKYYLKILHTSTKDFGDYKCTAENNLGNDTRSLILTGNCCCIKKLFIKLIEVSKFYEIKIS